MFCHFILYCFKISLYCSFSSSVRLIRRFCFIVFLDLKTIMNAIILDFFLNTCIIAKWQKKKPVYVCMLILNITMLLNVFKSKSFREDSRMFSIKDHISAGGNNFILFFCVSVFLLSTVLLLWLRL